MVKRGRPKGIKIDNVHYWSKEEKEYLAKITPGKTYLQIVELMNKKFKYQFDKMQIKRAINRYKLNTGLKGGYTNIEPWNKGKKGYMGANKASFKKGHRPANYVPIGTEKLDINGNWLVKAKTGKWRLKHRVLYEEMHGSIPKGKIVIFADGNKYNFDKDNLISVTQKQLGVMTKNKFARNKESIHTVLAITNLIIKVDELEKPKKNTRCKANNPINSVP